MRQVLLFSGVALGVLTFLLVGPLCRTAAAEEAWEREVRAAEAEEDRLLDEARQRGTTRQLVRKYASRVSRQPTALNQYLLGRALYYDGDVEGAERQLRKALQIQPGFWFATLRLAMLEVQRKRPAEAQRLLAQVMRVKPREPAALKLLIQLRMEAKDWPGSLRASEDLLAQEPTNTTIRRNMALILMAMEDWERALMVLRYLRGKAPRDPAIRWYTATCLFQLGKLDEAAREFEGLLRLAPDDLRALDMLRLIYAQQEDWKSLEKTLERMLPLLPTTTEEGQEIAGRVREMLRRLKAGERPGQEQPAAAGEWPENTWMALIEKATDATDVEGRRKALQSYFEIGYPRMPNVLVRRAHPDHEPDPICRQWLVRIMGQMQNPALAQVTAYCLYDPDVGVREKAAETLGEIATPSGLIYLMPVLLGMRVEDPPAETQILEMNAARRGMIQITGRLDAWGGGDTWIEPANLAAMQQDWLTWLQSPEGAHARIRGIGDIEAQGDLRPELHLLEDVSDPEPEIAKAAYKVLLNRSKVASEDKVAAAMWPRFPVFPDSQLTAEGLGSVRSAVKAWWADWRAMRAKREAERKDG